MTQGQGGTWHRYFVLPELICKRPSRVKISTSGLTTMGRWAYSRGISPIALMLLISRLKNITLLLEKNPAVLGAELYQVEPPMRAIIKDEIAPAKRTALS